MPIAENKLSTSSPSPDGPIDLVVRDLGCMRYGDALALQRHLHAEVVAGREAANGRMYLLLVEHDPPVITISRRPGVRQHLIASDAQLEEAGVEVAETDRGGDITYHGPGQLVVYPILDLNRLGLRLTSYMRFLEQVVIDTLAQFGIKGMRDPSATGVWVQPRDAHGLQSMGVERPENPAHAKICALGVRLSRWVSMHGLALNVTTNLNHFNLIVPCGLAGRGVASMQRELGNDCPNMSAVKAAIVRQFSSAMPFRREDMRAH